MKIILNLKWEIFITFIVLLISIYCLFLTYFYQLGLANVELTVLRIITILMAPLTYILFRTFRKYLKDEIFCK